jgi:hypothetical protein
MLANNNAMVETALALRGTNNVTAPAPGAPGSPEFEQTAMFLAREFKESMDELAHGLDVLNAACKRLDDAFVTPGEERHFKRFDVDVEFRRHRCRDISEIRAHMEREAWGDIIDKLGVKNVMSVKRRKEFDEQLQKGELPPICEQTITGIMLGFAGQAEEFAREAAVEVFDLLRPGQFAWSKKYKTNSVFRVGRKVILSRYMVEHRSGGGFRVNYNQQQELTAIDGVFHLLDGRGIMREHMGPLIQAINATGPDGCGETEFFRFQCFKNHNLHIWFKRLDLVQDLNFLAAGERVLGPDMRPGQQEE